MKSPVTDKKKVSRDIRGLLISTNSYREFLSSYFALKRRSQPSFSYQQFSSKAGFLSKSFIRDVIEGRKRLTERSLPKVLRALSLNAKESRIFELIVCTEEEFLDHTGSSSIDHLRSELRRLKKSLDKGPRVEKELKQHNRYSSSLDWPVVYAALGSKQSGESIENIVAKTNLSFLECKNILSKMLEEEVVSSKGDRFFPKDFHLVFKQRDSQGFFRDFFLSNSSKATNLASSHYNLPDCLFLSSSFSISKRRLLHLKEDLRALLLNYVDDIEDEDGDAVVVLNCSMVPQSLSTVYAASKNSDTVGQPHFSDRALSSPESILKQLKEHGTSLSKQISTN